MKGDFHWKYFQQNAKKVSRGMYKGWSDNHRGTFREVSLGLILQQDDQKQDLCWKRLFDLHMYKVLCNVIIF